MRMSGIAGSENHLVQLAATLSERSWDCDVLIPTPAPEKLHPLADELAPVCKRVELMPMGHDVSLKLVRRLIGLLSSGRYDIAHAHLVHADWHLAVASAFSPDVPLVSSKHNPDPFRRGRAFRVGERIALRRYSAVIGISDSLSDFTKETTKVTPVTIHYGLAAPVPRPPVPEASEVTRLLAVGRLEEQKAFEVAIQATALLRTTCPGVRLEIAGEGSERDRLTEMIRAQGLADSVSLLGERRDINQLMQSADVLVHPARWEGFGLVLLEAMSAGLAIVASRVGSVPEIVQDGVTGVLIPPDDPEALANALSRLIRSPALCRQLGVAGFRRLESVFSAEEMGDRTSALYASVLGS
jgi:glycosyltransferase involved in cell wall biosynthesis